MQKIFVRYLCLVISVAFLLIFALNWGLQGRNAERENTKNAKLKLAQISQTLDNNEIELSSLKESLSEDYLTRAYAFAYIIEQNPAVLDSQDELQRITKLLNVDELHVIDENGILYAGNIPRYFGMDFHNTEQTQEFLHILDDEDAYLVQDIRPNGYEQKIFQYIGVARKDRKGIVQVGMAPTRMLEAQKRNELTYIMERIPVETGSTLFAIDRNTGELLAHSDESLTGKDMEELGFTGDNLSKFWDGGFLTKNGEKMYYVLQLDQDVVLGVGRTTEVLYEDRNRQSIMISSYLVLTGLIVIVLIHLLVKKKIVNGIHTIMNEIHCITEGNLHTVVEVESNPEFKELSSGINKMVRGITEASGRVSKIIDSVDTQLGVFEIENGKEEIMATARLGEILGWTREEAQEIYQDKQRFAEMLRKIMECPLEGEEDIYCLGGKDERWVKIQMSEEMGGRFGVVTDVTRDIRDKKKIQHERDFDSLTGLCNLDMLKREVEAVLEAGDVKAAAMVMLDLDNFKGINDKYGHDLGDEYLRICARLMKAFNGERGIASRRSGDEFCIFLHHYETREGLREKIKAFYRSVEEEKITFPDGTVKAPGISAGIAWYDERLKNCPLLLKAADYALYDAKNSGKGVIREYTLE